VTEAAEKECIAFVGDQCVSSGPLRRVVAAIKDVVEPEDLADVLIFDSADSRVIELDLRGSREEVLTRLPAGDGTPAEPAPKKRGRPKLGVVAREVTLLPRHWEWLSGQPGGASVALRKLVERARRDNSHRDETRRAQESCYRFMSAMAGNRPHFEEAARALFAGEGEIFAQEIAAWPENIRAHSAELAQAVFDNARAAGRDGEED
jgi:hypothetical protein